MTELKRRNIILAVITVKKNKMSLCSPSSENIIQYFPWGNYNNTLMLYKSGGLIKLMGILEMDTDLKKIIFIVVANRVT